MMRNPTAVLLSLLAGVALASAGAGTRAATIVVDRSDTFDVPGVSGCSLLRAFRLINAGTDLYAANHECTFTGTLGSGDRISFALGAGTPTITISEDGVSSFNLPPLTKSVIIDGTTGGATRIRIVPGPGASGPALQFQARANLVGLVVGGFSPQQIDASGDFLGIDGSFIGTDASGNVAHGGSGAGLRFSGNVLDLGHPTSRNVFSGNGGPGVEIVGTGTNIATLDSNYIGVGADGTTPVGNCSATADCAGLLIHDTKNVDLSSNVVSSNLGDGIRIVDTLPFNEPAVHVYGLANRIGVAADGTTPRGNGGGNGLPACGLRLTAVLPSGADVFGTGNLAGPFDNTIANNEYCGVLVQGEVNVDIRVDPIYDNGVIGIDLSASAAGDGATANDANGHASGPGHWQNHPDLTAVIPSGDGKVTVSGTLSSPNTPNVAARIDLFANPMGSAQGKSPIIGATVMLDGSGFAAFTIGPCAAPSDQPVITATARTVNGTSELSAPLGPVDLVFASGFE